MKNKDYWNNYYNQVDRTSPPQAPSQFGAFVLSELSGLETQIVDFGCGNGRDAFFFARHGYNVVGVDGSQTAIDVCCSAKHPNTKFVCANVSEADFGNVLLDHLETDKRDGITAYARFFIHAIDDDAQNSLLTFIEKIIRNNGRAAFEFRTDKDKDQTKITSDHYRRFVSSLDFLISLNDLGLRVRYFVEGFGFAKYQDDDAHVARFIVDANR